MSVSHACTPPASVWTVRLRVLGDCTGRCRLTLAWSLGLAFTGDPQEAAAEEIEVCPAKHVPRQHFQPVNVAFDGTVAPRQRHPPALTAA
jgi:hypothetical protein